MIEKVAVGLLIMLSAIYLFRRLLAGLKGGKGKSCTKCGEI